MQYEDLIGNINELGRYRDDILPEEMDFDNDTFQLHKQRWEARKADMVNSPMHYTSGRTEAINVIEDAVRSCEDPVAAVLQSQVLKYMLRLWLKGNEKQDAQKAQWYLNRLVEHLNNA